MNQVFVPDEVIRLLPVDSIPLVEAILARARRHRMRVLLVGGPVRDLILARPIRDIDLTVEPKGERDAAWLAREAAPTGGRVSVHSRFGTASISADGGDVDLANLRRESYARPGALPDVERGTLEEDLARRDFSINALALPLTVGRRDEPSTVLDPWGGLEDLEAGRLRILHPRSFHDDPTRALRAARLAPRLGFALSRGTRSAMRDALRDGAFGGVSGDRLRHEIDRCFGDARLGLDPAQALRRLAEWHILGALEPELSLPREAVAPLRRLGRSIAEPAWKSPKILYWSAGLAVWLAAVTPALRGRTLARLSVQGERAKRIVSFARARDASLRQLEGTRGRGAVDGALAGIEEERLLALHAWAPTATRRRIARWAAEDRSRRSPVTGTDLTELGLSGPAIGRALTRIRSGYLDGAIANREEALALARELGRRSSGRSAPRSRRG